MIKYLTEYLTTSAWPARLARLAQFGRDLGTSVKHNRNQLWDYIITGPGQPDYPGWPGKPPSVSCYFPLYITYKGKAHHTPETTS